MNSAGADTALNFNKGNVIMKTNITDKSTTVIEIGFRATKIIFIRRGSGTAYPLAFIYDSSVSTTTFIDYTGTTNTTKNIGGDVKLLAIDDTSFTISSTMNAYTYSYLAIG